MSYQSLPPPPTGERWTDWGTRLNQYLGRIRSQLQHKLGNESADTDGVLLYDPDIDHVVVSSNGVFEPLSYGHNCYAAFYTLVTHSAAATNTAYAITWENTALSVDITIAASPNTSRIVFEHGGVYQVDFSAELLSTNSSPKSIYIWPRINGVDVPYSTIVTSVDTNNNRIVTSRSGMFSVDAGDYLEAMFAVSDTALSIDGSAATLFAPESPSATIVITEIR